MQATTQLSLHCSPW